MLSGPGGNGWGSSPRTWRKLPVPCAGETYDGNNNIAIMVITIILPSLLLPSLLIKAYNDGNSDGKMMVMMVIIGEII